MDRSTEATLSTYNTWIPVKSSAKDLSLPKFEIETDHKTFNGNSGSCAAGPRPNACHVTVEVGDNTA